MRWFQRGREDAGLTPASLPGEVDPADSPAELRRTMEDINQFINRNAGRLPGAAVVNARRLTDTLREILDTSDGRQLDVYVLLPTKGILVDYLPTTLRSYLAVDISLQDTPRGSGRTPTESLMDQLESLQASASATLVAARNQDADALITQGNFLRTKFSGSDLDL